MEKNGTHLTVSPIREIAFGQYGGAECFFADVDGDGEKEILTYQGPGVFGPEPYRSWEHVRALFPKSVSVSAFRMDGSRMWTWGEPNPPDYPFISHSYEACLATGDIDGDGKVEVAVADGDRVVVLDGGTGEERSSAALPGENYYILQIIGHVPGKHEAAIAIKNGEAGTERWRYGEPVLGLNVELQPVWGPKAIPGGGHHILSMDLDGDGKHEYLVGYCAVGTDGEILWTADSVDAEAMEPGGTHVDYTDVLRAPDGRLLFAMAGSDRVYLVEEGGRTVFSHPHIHCQGTAIGQFRTDSAFQVALYNAHDGPMVLYDPSGRELWSMPTERTWPLGVPKGCADCRMHRNRPLVTLRGERTWIGYADGGWPWGMDGEGAVSLTFSPPENSRMPDCPEGVPDSVRRDDIGFSFAMQTCDIDNDGRQEALIYDRRFLWVYPLV